MKNHYNKISLTLYYLLEKHGVENATLKEIHKSQKEAKTWFDSKIPLEYLDTIKAKHGFTHESWDEVMLASGSFYFIPTEQMDACNKEIRAYLNNFLHINSIDRDLNYTAEQLNQQITKRVNPLITRFKYNKLWHYQLTQKAYEDIKNKLNTQSHAKHCN